jgi:hypothetical protein
MAKRRGCFAATALACGLAVCCQPALAGLTLDQAIARHRTLLDNDLHRAGDFALLAPTPDGLDLAVGGPSRDIPYLMTPFIRGRGGLRALSTPIGKGPDGEGPTLRIGVNVQYGARPGGTLEGTLLGWPLGPGEAYASMETRHWGPGWIGSLILDAGAPAVPAVGWRKTRATPFESRWLAWLGPWNADFFIGQLSGHEDPARPRLIGMRMQFRPLTGLEIGASRAIQWGGRGRDESLRSLTDSLLGRDNQSGNQDPGNQLGGFDLRWTLPAGDRRTWAVYAQAIGEDEAGGLPSQYMVQAGVDLAGRSAPRSWRLFAELTDLVASDVSGHPKYGSAYRNHKFAQGYTQWGLPLGHAAGGDVRLGSLGGLIEAGQISIMLSTHVGRAAPQAQRFVAGSSLGGVNLGASRAMGTTGRVGLSWWYWRVGGAPSQALQAWWHTAWQ